MNLYPDIPIPDKVALPVLRWICVSPGRLLLYTTAWTQLVLAGIIVHFGAPIDILLFAAAILTIFHYCMKGLSAEYQRVVIKPISIS